MNQGAKTLAAIGVLAGGFVVALMFRRDAPVPQTHASATSPLVLQQGGSFRNGADSSAASGNPVVPKSTATILAPMDFAEPPGSTDRDGRYEAGPVDWRRDMMPSARPDQPRLHKIRDGDTLQSLADQYLGSPERYWEIYEANRNVLSSPQVLPIGKKLKIPPKKREEEESPKTSASSPNMMPKRRLVPLHGSDR